MKRAVAGPVMLAAVLASAPASANIGVPMIAVFLPPLWLSLLPVIVVEAWVVSRWLPLAPGRAFSGSAIGNFASTVIGVPLMWMFLAVFQLALAGTARGLSSIGARAYAVTVQAPWLIPYEEDLKWMIPIALVVLAVPAYALSVLIEWRCLLPFTDPHHRPRTLRVVAAANAASYAALVVLFAIVLIAGDRLNAIGSLFKPVTMFFVENVFSVAQSVIRPGQQ